MSLSADNMLRRAEKLALQSGGLGCRKMAFPCKGSFMDVKAKLESVYPELKDGGGFELLRIGSPSSKLALIVPPAKVYSVPFLGRHWTWSGTGLY